MRCLIVIPARGGSTRVPRKNLQHLRDMRNQSDYEPPDLLVMRACHQAATVAALLSVPWAVSTDSAKTVILVEEWFGARHIFARGHATEGDGPMAPVLLEVADAARSDGIQGVVCLQPTSPLRQPEDIVEAMERMHHSGARSLVSIDESTGKRNGAIFITRVEMLRDGLVFDDDSLKYPMPHERSLDVNTPEDLEEDRRILG